MARNTVRKPATEYAVTGILAGNEARTEFITVPGLRFTVAEVRAAILGGTNGRGETVPGGWDTLICDTCGETHEWCPDLRRVLGI